MFVLQIERPFVKRSLQSAVFLPFLLFHDEILVHILQQATVLQVLPIIDMSTPSRSLRDAVEKHNKGSANGEHRV
jgi:hypothetical protein